MNETAFRCYHCYRVHTVPVGSRGEDITCSCGRRIRVPQAGARRDTPTALLPVARDPRHPWGEAGAPAPVPPQAADADVDEEERDDPDEDAEPLDESQETEVVSVAADAVALERLPRDRVRGDLSAALRPPSSEPGGASARAPEPEPEPDPVSRVAFGRSTGRAPAARALEVASPAGDDGGAPADSASDLDELIWRQPSDELAGDLDLSAGASRDLEPPDVAPPAVARAPEAGDGRGARPSARPAKTPARETHTMGKGYFVAAIVALTAWVIHTSPWIYLGAGPEFLREPLPEVIGLVDHTHYLHLERAFWSALLAGVALSLAGEGYLRRRRSQQHGF